MMPPRLAWRCWWEAIRDPRLSWSARYVHTVLLIRAKRHPDGTYRSSLPAWMDPPDHFR